MLFVPLAGFEVVVDLNPAKEEKSIWFLINIHIAKQFPYTIIMVNKLKD